MVHEHAAELVVEAQLARDSIDVAVLAARREAGLDLLGREKKHAALEEDQEGEELDVLVDLGRPHRAEAEALELHAEQLRRDAHAQRLLRGLQRLAGALALVAVRAVQPLDGAEGPQRIVDVRNSRIVLATDLERERLKGVELVAVRAALEARDARGEAATEEAALRH